MKKKISQETLEALSDGHSMWPREFANHILEEFQIPFSDDLVMRWNSQADANPTNDWKGLWLTEDKPGEGVPSLRLSNYVLRYLGLQIRPVSGRGARAMLNTEAIKAFLDDGD